ncbi:MAG: ketoacyl-ACP synthase III [Bacteroidia bacterium]|nr:ketoacyl-ACP synthase III [Bacteroidia bacterium]
MKAFIRHITYHLPELKLTNAELCKQFPEITEEEIYKRTGVKVRRIALNENDRSKDKSGSDLAYECTLKFFQEHKVNPETIDFLLFCTVGLDYKIPATASILQHRLGLPKQIGAIDIPMGCTGFVNGLSLSKGLVETGQATNVLLLTAEVPSYVIHPNDLELKMLFGDAAAATLIQGKKNSKAQIGSFVFGSDGSGANHMRVKASGVREPISETWLNEYKSALGMKYGLMEMNGKEIFIFALKVVPAMIDRLLKKEGLVKDEIDLFILHQANGFLLETLRKKMGIPEHKFFVYIEAVGNTVSASIPIALTEAMRMGRVKKGNKILLAGFGVGFAWGGTIITI